MALKTPKVLLEARAASSRRAESEERGGGRFCSSAEARQAARRLEVLRFPCSGLAVSAICTNRFFFCAFSSTRVVVLQEMSS